MFAIKNVGQDDEAYTKVIDDNSGKEGGCASGKMDSYEDNRKSKPFLPITPYLDEDAKKALHAYKYSAEDRQYCYIYCFNPLSKKIASLTPSFIA